MNTLLTALLAPAAVDVASLKSFESSDLSKAPAQADEFAQTFHSTTELSQRQSSGERLPSSGKDGKTTPPPRTPERTSAHSHRPDPSARTAKPKPATRNAKALTATDAEIPPRSPLASVAAPVQGPLAQTTESRSAQAPSPIVASGSTQQTSPVASSADVTKLAQASAGSAQALPVADAAATAAQPQELPATADHTIDSSSVSVGAKLALPADVSSPAVTFSADSVAAATFTPESPLPPSSVAKLVARAPALQGSADASPSGTTPSDGTASSGSVVTDIANVIAAPTIGAAPHGNPSPPPVNPMALNLGVQAAAANPGLMAPVDTKAGVGGSTAPVATSTPVRLAGMAEWNDKEPALAQQNTPDSGFAAVQALVNAGANSSAGGTGSTDAAGAPILNVAQPVESSDFGRGVANQVSVMVDNNLNVAKLQVNPASLGPIEVRIALQAGHAQVWMTSHSAVTRDALQDSASHLKEILGQQGFGQVSVDISHRQFQERAAQSFTYERNRASEESVVSAPGQSAAPAHARRSDGKLDAYA